MGNWGEIRMVGDWQKVALLIQNMAMEMEKAKITSLQRFGLKMEEVVLNIDLVGIQGGALNERLFRFAPSEGKCT